MEPNQVTLTGNPTTTTMKGGVSIPALLGQLCFLVCGVLGEGGNQGTRSVQELGRGWDAVNSFPMFPHGPCSYLPSSLAVLSSEKPTSLP